MARTRKDGFNKVMAVVSVITPTFNRADFLPAAISSVLAQAHEDFELIVVDNGSVDDTCAVIKPFLDDKRRRFAANEMIIRNFLEQYGDGLSRQDVRWGLSRFYCRSARYFASIGETRKAARAIFLAFGNSPLDSVVWRALFRVLVPRK